MILKCNLRKLAFDRDIRSISELQRITGVSRPTLYKMYDNRDLETIKMESYKIVCKKLECKKLNELIEFEDEAGEQDGN